MRCSVLSPGCEKRNQRKRLMYFLEKIETSKQQRYPKGTNTSPSKVAGMIFLFWRVFQHLLGGWTPPIPVTTWCPKVDFFKREKAMKVGCPGCPSNLVSILGFCLIYPPLKLTNRTWKLMVERLIFFWDLWFQGRTCWFQGVYLYLTVKLYVHILILY